MNLTGVFTSELDKVAKIFGAMPDPIASSTHPAIDPKMRERAIHDYAVEKSQEKPTHKLLALLGGGVSGGAMGALTGGAIGGGHGALAGGGIGALLGGGLGAWLHRRDVNKIEHAKGMLHSDELRQRMLGKLMADAEEKKTRDLSPTRAMLMKHLLEKIDRQNVDRD